MHALAFDKKVRVVSALVEGCSIRATERLTDVARNTIGRLNITVGEACRRLHNVMFRGLQVNVLEVDEIWAFIQKKQKRLTDADPPERGDCYTYLGIDANRKGIVSFTVGKRDMLTTNDFIVDLKDRITNRPQITTDGLVLYIEAIQRAFGCEVDYAQIIKTYAVPPEDERRYSPPKCIGSKKKIITGNPDRSKISTSYIERQNLTVRMQIRRFTRLCNGFSKKLRNHTAAVALYVCWYNFVRIHETLRVTPAMAIGVTGHAWSVAELMDAALQIAPEDAPRLPAHEDPSTPQAPVDAPLPVDDRQLSLLDWQPRPLRQARPTVDMEQIDLFPAPVAVPAQG